MDSKKRKCMLVAAILNIAALVMVIGLIAVCAVSVASASSGGGDFFLGENPKTTTAYNGYQFNPGPGYDNSGMLVVGANDKLLFVKLDGYGVFVVRDYTTNCTIDARNEVVSIKENCSQEEVFLYSGYFNSSITISVGGRSFEYWSYDSEQNMIGCVMGYKIYNVLFDETMLEDFNVVQGSSASTTTARLIVNKRAFCTNNNLSNIPKQLFREDISENTNINWYGRTFNFYNSSTDYTVMGRNDNLLFIKDSFGIMRIVKDWSDYDYSYDYYNNTVSSSQNYSHSVYEASDFKNYSFSLNGDMYKVYGYDYDNMLYIKKDQVQSELYRIKMISTMITDFREGTRTLIINEENFCLFNAINSNTSPYAITKVDGKPVMSDSSTMDQDFTMNSGVEYVGVLVALVIFCIVNLVFACLLLRKPKNDKTKFLASTIVCLVLGIHMLGALMGMMISPIATNFIGVLIPIDILLLGSVVMYIVTLCVGNPKKLVQNVRMRSPAVQREYDLDDEIRDVCKLYQDNVLSKEDLKRIIIKKIRAE